MEEFFEVRFANSEQEFIHNGGVNKGYVELPHKIVRCYLMDPCEKHLYSQLRGFAYGDKRTCYPSHEKLMGYSGWSKPTLKKYMQSLVRGGLISIIERTGTTNEYVIEELHKSTLVVHSEMLHLINNDHFKRMEAKFNELKNKYIESELCKEVSESINPLSYEEIVTHWFLNEGNETNEESEKVAEKVDEPQPKKSTPNIAAAKGVAQTNKEITIVADPDRKEKTKKKKSFNHSEVSLEEWNTHHFFNYYEELYQKKMNFVMPEHSGDRAQLKALVARYSKEKLKERIDLFFSSDSFKSVKMNIYSFSSGNIQAKLDKILNFGDSNSYKANGKKVDPSKQSQLDKWKKDIGAKR